MSLNIETGMANTAHPANDNAPEGSTAVQKSGNLLGRHWIPEIVLSDLGASEPNDKELAIIAQLIAAAIQKLAVNAANDR